MAERRNQLMKSGAYREPLSPISLNQASSRTPHKKRNTSFMAKTPSGKATPNKKSLTSSNNEGAGYDRFIPNRALMNKEVYLCITSFFTNIVLFERCLIFSYNNVISTLSSDIEIKVITKI